MLTPTGCWFTVTVFVFANDFCLYLLTYDLFLCYASDPISGFLLARYIGILGVCSVIAWENKLYNSLILQDTDCISGLYLLAFSHIRRLIKSLYSSFIFAQVHVSHTDVVVELGPP